MDGHWLILLTSKNQSVVEQRPESAHGCTDTGESQGIPKSCLDRGHHRSAEVFFERLDGTNRAQTSATDKNGLRVCFDNGFCECISAFQINGVYVAVGPDIHAMRTGDLKATLLEESTTTLCHLVNVRTNKAHFFYIEFSQRPYGSGRRRRAWNAIADTFDSLDDFEIVAKAFEKCCAGATKSNDIERRLGE
jgi:hypothetical protein